MNIAAFDLSLTATGWATIDNDGLAFSGVILCKKTGLARLRHVRDRVLEVAQDADVVVIEGYAFARPNQAHQLGELGGVIRLAFFELEKPLVEIAPASLKLFATGHGNAKKDEVLAAAIRKLPYAGHDHNEADALWLLQMVQCKCGDRFGENEHQRRALAKIVWPEMAAV